MRTYVFLALPVLLLACSGDKDTDTGTATTEPSTSTSTTTSTTTTVGTTTTSSTTTTTSTTTSTSTASGLLGVWFLQTTMGPSPVQLTWSILASPSCTISVELPGSAQVSVTQCEYTATATEVTFRDTDCPQYGTYSYTIVGDQLQLAAVSEPCPDRSTIMELPWTLVVP